MRPRRRCPRRRFRPLRASSFCSSPSALLLTTGPSPRRPVAPRTPRCLATTRAARARYARNPRRHTWRRERRPSTTQRETRENQSIN